MSWLKGSYVAPSNQRQCSVTNSYNYNTYSIKDILWDAHGFTEASVSFGASGASESYSSSRWMISGSCGSSEASGSVWSSGPSGWFGSSGAPGSCGSSGASGHAGTAGQYLQTRALLQKYKSETCLSTEIWRIKNLGGTPFITWRPVKQYPGFNPTTGRCALCLNEKLEILNHQGPNLINKRDEIVSTCRHRRKFLLAHLTSEA